MRTILATALFCFGMIQISQSQNLASDHAYWVMERNIQQPDRAIIKFYDGADRLLHEMRIEKRVINIHKRRDQRMLNHLLKKYMERTGPSGKKLRSRTSV
jgi:hypothetical protein